VFAYSKYCFAREENDRFFVKMFSDIVLPGSDEISDSRHVRMHKVLFCISNIR